VLLGTCFFRADLSATGNSNLLFRAYVRFLLVSSAIFLVSSAGRCSLFVTELRFFQLVFFPSMYFTQGLTQDGRLLPPRACPSYLTADDCFAAAPTLSAFVRAREAAGPVVALSPWVWVGLFAWSMPGAVAAVPHDSRGRPPSSKSSFLVGGIFFRVDPFSRQAPRFGRPAIGWSPNFCHRACVFFFCVFLFLAPDPPSSGCWDGTRSRRVCVDRCTRALALMHWVGGFLLGFHGRGVPAISFAPSGSSSSSALTSLPHLLVLPEDCS